MSFVQHLPLNLLILRTAKRLSQEELANDISCTYNCDVCQSTISRIEARRHVPNLSLVVHFANYFGTTVDALLSPPTAYLH